MDEKGRVTVNGRRGNTGTPLLRLFQARQLPRRRTLVEEVTPSLLPNTHSPPFAEDPIVEKDDVGCEQITAFLTKHERPQLAIQTIIQTADLIVRVRLVQNTTMELLLTVSML